MHSCLRLSSGSVAGLHQQQANFSSPRCGISQATSSFLHALRCRDDGACLVGPQRRCVNGAPLAGNGISLGLAPSGLLDRDRSRMRLRPRLAHTEHYAASDIPDHLTECVTRSTVDGKPQDQLGVERGTGRHPQNATWTSGALCSRQYCSMRQEPCAIREDTERRNR